jgi:hypothetical protein
MSLDIMMLKRLLETSAADDFEDRHYLGMSAISQCPRKLYQEMLNGRDRPGQSSLNLFHEGYVHEHDIVDRLAKMGCMVGNVQRELVAPWDERLRGHIDGEIEGELLEIKSLNADRFDQLRAGGPFIAHVEQAQLYMRYGGYRSAVFVYKNRETGALWIDRLWYNESLAQKLEDQARMILQAVDRVEPPACMCGHCG